jgi:hypothetical protein
VITARHLRRLLGPLALAGLLGAAAPAMAEVLDEPLYASLLRRYTREVPDLAGTRVDYAGLGRSADWKRLVANLERTDPGALATRNAKLAYWIDAYNILVIDRVVAAYPVDSIKDLGGLFRPVWKQEAGRIAGRPFTLHEIEHEILRPMGDPRIHAAIVCASLSCPSLRREPFTAARLDAQLDDSVRSFLADRRKGLAVDRDADRVELSRIFDWFAEDFAAAGGVVPFVARYAPDGERAWLERHGAGASLRYFDYDWRLNDLARTPGDG